MASLLLIMMAPTPAKRKFKKINKVSNYFSVASKPAASVNPLLPVPVSVITTTTSQPTGTSTSAAEWLVKRSGSSLFEELPLSSTPLTKQFEQASRSTTGTRPTGTGTDDGALLDSPLVEAVSIYKNIAFSSSSLPRKTAESSGTTHTNSLTSTCNHGTTSTMLAASVLPVQTSNAHTDSPTGNHGNPSNLLH